MRFVFLISLLFAGLNARALVAAEDLLFDSTVDMTAVAALTPLQVTEDLKVLRFAVLNGYSGPKQLLQEVSDLLKVPPLVTNSTDFCSVLESEFQKIQDHHLNAYLNYAKCDVPSILVGGVGANVLNGKTWELSTRSIQGHDVFVLAISHFAPSNDPSWNGFLDAAVQLRQQNAPFILDLRGNTGGDDEFGFELARILYGLKEGSSIPLPLESVTVVQTPTAFAMRTNYWNYEIDHLVSLGMAVPQFVTDNAAKTRDWYDHSVRAKGPASYVQQIPVAKFNARNVFDKNVYVLIDRMCASSCETSLQALEALPHRILVGEATAGTVEYGNVGIVRLPNSHISVVLATIQNHYFDSRNPEKLGYAPQIPAAVNEDALDLALQDLAKTF